MTNGSENKESVKEEYYEQLTAKEIEWVQLQIKREEACKFTWDWILLRVKIARIIGAVILTFIGIYYFLWDGFKLMVEKAIG